MTKFEATEEQMIRNDVAITTEAMGAIKVFPKLSRWGIQRLAGGIGMIS